MCKGNNHDFEDGGHYCKCGRIGKPRLASTPSGAGTLFWEHLEKQSEGHEEQVIKLLTEIRDLLKGSRL